MREILAFSSGFKNKEIDQQNDPSFLDHLAIITSKIDQTQLHKNHNLKLQ